MRIFKYPLALVDVQYVNLPAHARIVKCGVQNDVITIWAMIDSSRKEVTRRFNIVGTGEPIPDNVKYLDTVFIGSFVWHLFEGIRLKDSRSFQ